MRELIFHEYNMNTFIDVQMSYFINDNYKPNIIWGRYFNTWLTMTNNKNFWVESAKYIMELLNICVMKYIHHASYKDNVLEVHMTNTIHK